MIMRMELPKNKTLNLNKMFSGIEFANPWMLLLLILLPSIGIWYYVKRNQQHPVFNLSSTHPLHSFPKSIRQRLIILLPVLRMLCIGFIIIALARPQTKSSSQDVSVEGIDIAMALDISGSMLAEDFKPNRLEAAKKLTQKFIESRPNDRMGLVVFSGEAFTQCPLTTDHAVLLNLFQSIKMGMIDDGTALGDGLATAVNRLRYSIAKSKVIILLTDGINNAGSIDPRTAAEIANMYKIRIYTIGVGTLGKAPYPFQTPFGTQYQTIDVQIDEGLLKGIANSTGGEYYRATNNKALEEIFNKIDKLEKSKITVSEYSRKSEKYFLLLLIALSLFTLELLLRETWLNPLP